MLSILCNLMLHVDRTLSPEGCSAHSVPPAAAAVPTVPERRLRQRPDLRGLQAHRPAVRCVWRQRRLPALRSENVRGLQGFLQADCAEERQVRLPGGQELPRRQAEAEPVPVLPLPEVPGCRHGQGGESVV